MMFCREREPANDADATVREMAMAWMRMLSCLKSGGRDESYVDADAFRLAIATRSRTKFKYHMEGSGMSNVGLHRIGSLLSRHKAITVLCVLGLFVYGYSWVVSPHVNSAPTQKVVISGQFPFSKGLDLSLQASFYSRNPTCKRTPQVFLIIPAASDINREIDLDLPVKRGDGDRYTAELNLDHFSPGFCDWQYGRMSYQFSGGRLSRAGLSHALGPFPTRDRRMTYNCEYHTISKPVFLTVSCGLPLRLPNDISKTSDTAELDFTWK